MPLSWNEIKHRAIAFARDWKGTTSEKSERQTFWNEFFEVFGKKRRSLAAFEEPVKKLSGNWGYIDLFWPGTCLVEHKTAGQDLGKAFAQGMEYVRGLIDSGRDAEVPRWLIVSDFERIAIHDLEPEQDPDLPLFQRLPPSVEFPLKELHKNVRHFAFVAGYKYHKLNPEDPANFQATELMARLHDALWDGGYRGHQLCQFLVRLLFCFFADDTGIFPSDHFKLYLGDRTAEDGSDLGTRLAHLFQVLNTPEDQRGKNLDEDLAQFPYVNGDLFAEPLHFADFTSHMRAVLLECAAFRWEKISPAVFGSLFQTVFDHEDDRKRRQLGAHYTSEKNILKVVRSLFLDELRAEFAAACKDKSGRGPGRLRDLQKKLASLKILDPACGCGNFLVITYRELRQLELEILLQLHAGQQQFAEEEVFNLSQINVDQMFGIEIEEFPARIAEVALWLADHQANLLLSEAFGQFYRRIPLRKSPHIHVANALRKDWKEVLPPDECSYILGNPPFIGKHYRSQMQTDDLISVMPPGIKVGDIDFVSGWYVKSGDYIQNTTIRVALVSTNSITQGEQVPALWPLLLNRYGLKIHFAHRTFKWESEARGKAHVHCVIIGFGHGDCGMKKLYDYEPDPEQPLVSVVSNICPYLIEYRDIIITKAQKPYPPYPEMRCGNKPADGKNFIFKDRKSLRNFLDIEPAAEPFIRPYVGSEEFIHGSERWCLWLEAATPAELRGMPAVLDRVTKVKEFREKSTAAPTRKAAAYPARFFFVSQPTVHCIAVPEVSSENRAYIPIGFLSPDVIASNKLYLLPTQNAFILGTLSSAMHMAWVKTISGRLESRYQYSGTMVYNTYPWPEGATDAQRAAVEKAAQGVLDARAKFPASTLADLYDPVTMPPGLAKAHADLDRAVDRCYRKEPFPHDRARVEHLFALYEKLTAPLAPSAARRFCAP